MATNVLMRKGCICHDVNQHDVKRWESYGYEVVNASPVSPTSGKEVAGETPVSPVASTEAPKRTTTRKKVQKDDKS